MYSERFYCTNRSCEEFTLKNLIFPESQDARLIADLSPVKTCVTVKTMFRKTHIQHYLMQQKRRYSPEQSRRPCLLLYHPDFVEVNMKQRDELTK